MFYVIPNIQLIPTETLYVSNVVATPGLESEKGELLKSELGEILQPE
jgi:hypothetical protein